MTRFLKPLFILVLLLLLLTAASALADPSLTFAPENPRVGDYVDVTVTPDREGAVAVRYSLSTPNGVVYSFNEKKEKDSFHCIASCKAAVRHPRFRHCPGPGR